MPIEERNAKLAKLLSHEHPGIAFNQHYEAEGAISYKHACALGREGIVSKRLGSPYRPLAQGQEPGGAWRSGARPRKTGTAGGDDAKLPSGEQ